MCALLAGQAYAVLRDWLPAAIALRDPGGREVDLHPVDPTPDGGGDQVLVAPGLPPGGPTSWHYGPPVIGRVGERPVRCASAADQLEMHEGYVPRATDRADVRLLAARFDLPLPDWAR